jgi:DNA polymerase III alpha subunit
VLIGALSSQIWGSWSKGPEAERMREIGLDPDSPRLQQTIRLIDEIIGFPRHLSQHVGGFVITEGRLDELVPIENATMEDRTVICWDKDDIDALGILKVDVLALGMLTCIRKAFRCCRRTTGRLHARHLPPEDPAVYDMLCKSDSLGVFQVESRAQMNFLPRMRPRCFYDLVIQVAIIRPGPIQGDMVHPFIRRRNGEEEVSFPLRRAGRRCWPRRWACRCFRNRRCRSPSSARASPPRRPTACAGRWPPSRNTATCQRISAPGS